MRKKRGQITIFIILGIIILFSFSLFFYLKQATTVFTPERIVPPELEPLDNFVSSCISRIAKEGVVILGGNGGFIRFPEEIKSNREAFLNYNHLFPDIKIPLWHYQGQTKLPSESYMEEDIAYYIDQNLDECLNNLDEFKEQFDIVELAERKIIVELTDKSVEVVLDYPLNIISKIEQQETKIDNFQTSVPYRLKTVYELARRIMEEQIRDKFIELRTIDLIALDEAIPYTDMEFRCTPKIWYTREIKDKLKNLLTVNLPLISVENTDYNDIPSTQEYVQSHYLWHVTDQKYKSTHVSFSYDENWPITLNVNPNEGAFIRSNAQRGSDIMSFLCMHMWHFTYDVKFPVMTTITDDAAKDHEKFTFTFGFEAGINKNVPESSSFGISTFDFERKATADSFCLEAPGNPLTVNVFENISMEEFGYDTDNPLSGVNLSFTCVRYKCPIGQTEYKFGGQIASLTAEVPYCPNGVLRGEKEDYETNQIFVTTNQEKVANLYLTPTISKDIEVVKHRVYRGSIGEEEPLEEDDMAIITFKRKNFKSSAIFPSTEDILNQIKLLAKWDYEYEVEIFLSEDKSIFSGGYKGTWTIPWKRMKGMSKLKFHVVEYPYTENMDKIIVNMNTLEADSMRMPQPEFIP